MHAHEILGVPSLTFIEPDYASLPDTAYNHDIAVKPGDEGRLLIDEDDTPLALAIGDGGVWTACSFHLRSADVEVIERFEAAAGEIWQEEHDVWEAAVREYYSSAIAARVPPGIEDCNPERARAVQEMFREELTDQEPGPCLDFCCGSGISTAALRGMGFAPVSLDNDPCLLSRGFASGRLTLPATLCIDARRAPSYVRPARFSIGLMFGEITSFNEDVWGPVIASMAALSDEGLITVGTEKEAEFVSKTVHRSGKTATVVENDRDPVYDRWICRMSG